MPVDLRNAEEGDYVLFRCGGTAQIEDTYDDGVDDDNFPIQLTFKGDETDKYSYCPNGHLNSVDEPSILDIMEVVPEYILKSKLAESLNDKA